jgi:hypothetical protein
VFSPKTLATVSGAETALGFIGAKTGGFGDIVGGGNGVVSNPFGDVGFIGDVPIIDPIWFVF